MAGLKFSLSREKQMSFPMTHGEKLIALQDGSCALVYIYSLYNEEGFSLDEAASALNLREEEIKTALEKLGRLGIIQSFGEEKIYPKEELPQYKAEDIIRKNKEDGEFAEIIKEAQRILGKTLSGPDLSILFGIYDRLGLGAELVFMLINHCADETRKIYGPARLPTMHAIEKEAYTWINEGVRNMEQAEVYLSNKTQRQSKTSQIKRVLQIDRSFSPTEKAYVLSWIDMNFAEDAISLAYDKTVVKTGKLAWKYMDTILQSWHSKNLHTKEEVEKGDSNTSKFRTSPQKYEAVVPQGTKVQDDSDLLERILNS